MADVFDPSEYEEFDFGFTAADEDELSALVKIDDETTPDEIKEMQEKLDLILQMNSTCEGATAVKDQYDELFSAKMNEVEKVIMPLLLHLKKNPEKNYIYWPGDTRTAQCDLQIQKVLSITRNSAL